MINGNEADVREEVIVPFLAALGYKRGTANDISREVSLSYPFESLGRKKTTDRPLRGRADYILSVLGVARWVLETKPYDSPITTDDIAQAQSYARHPEIAARYAVLSNGHRLVVVTCDQRQNDPPLINLEITSVEKLVEQCSSILSPEAIRRDCSLPVVDLNMPLCAGMRSQASIRIGTIQHREVSWEANVILPPEKAAGIERSTNLLRGMRATITGGKIWRDESSRVRVQLAWATTNAALETFADIKKLNEIEYVSLEPQLSQNADKPSLFETIGNISIIEGEPIYDVLNWTETIANVATNMKISGQALGYVDGEKFYGSYETQYEMTYPAIPALVIRMNIIGEVELTFDK